MDGSAIVVHAKLFRYPNFLSSTAMAANFELVKPYATPESLRLLLEVQALACL